LIDLSGKTRVPKGGKPPRGNAEIVRKPRGRPPEIDPNPRKRQRSTCVKMKVSKE